VRRTGDPHVLRRIAAIKLLNVLAGCDAADVTYDVDDAIDGSARRMRATDVVTGVSPFGVDARRCGVVFLCGTERLGVRERARPVPGVFVRDFERDFFGVDFGPLLTLRPRRFEGDADLSFAIVCGSDVDGDGRSSGVISGRGIEIG